MFRGVFLRMGLGLHSIVSFLTWVFLTYSHGSGVVSFHFHFGPVLGSHVQATCRV